VAASVGLAAGALTVGALAGPGLANAAYPPEPPVRTLDVTAFSPVCQSGAPYIQYDIKTVGFESTGPAKLTIRDINSRVVDTVTVSSLSGRILYPGAKVDASGKGSDWPGWTQNASGEWVVDTTDAILRSGLSIEVQVNPTATANVTYPPESSGCAGPAVASSPAGANPQQASGGTLPSTGSTGVEQSLMIAAGALLAGLVISGIAVVSRRRDRPDGATSMKSA
jgi:hypothetical protein